MLNLLIHFCENIIKCILKSNPLTRYNATERIGVTEVEKMFLLFGWIPRTVFQTDVGIDMTVEICHQGSPTGKFIGVQIKTGESYFKEKLNNSIIFRTDKTHADYWLNNSLPIIIVLHNIEENLTIWQAVNRQTVKSTGKGFKLTIPLPNLLNKNAKDNIEKIADGPPLLNKIQRLALDKPVIDKLNNGNKIVVELNCWINKSSGRADIKIYHVIDDDDEDEGLELTQDLLEEYSVIGVHSYQALYYFYPWADFSIDEKFYENFSDYDEDEKPGYQLIFTEDVFHGYQSSIIPYHNNGEISSFRLVMALNDYGKSFLDFFDFVEGKKQLMIKFS